MVGCGVRTTPAPRFLAGDDVAGRIPIAASRFPFAVSMVPVPPEHDHPEITSANARLGLWLFSVYCLAYGVFMYLVAFRVDILAMVTPLGPNVAIVYGFALIGGAFFTAVLYMLLCRTMPSSSDQEGTP
jgi:uncharacterized membrane protein (DUF485 family)